MHNPASRALRLSTAFTLIELLVVVTIIVVLISLLLPSLDKAIYQTQLAVCAAQLKGISTGTIAYAMDAKRHYPYRPGLHDTTLNWIPIWLRSAYNTQLDDRPLLKPYMVVNKFLNDPLNPGKVNYDDTAQSTDTHMYSGYALWFDWQYYPGALGQSGKTIGSETRMSKVGDRWSWTETDGKQKRFNILAGDYDRIHQGELSLNSHPDADDVLAPLVYQDHPAAGVGTTGAVKQTLNLWSSSTRADRGTMDMNTAFDDNSVRRDSKVRWNQYRDNGSIVQVPVSTDADRYNQFYLQVPQQ